MLAYNKEFWDNDIGDDNRFGSIDVELWKIWQ